VDKYVVRACDCERMCVCVWERESNPTHLHETGKKMTYICIHIHIYIHICRCLEYIHWLLKAAVSSCQMYRYHVTPIQYVATCSVLHHPGCCIIQCVASSSVFPCPLPPTWLFDTFIIRCVASSSVFPCMSHAISNESCYTHVNVSYYIAYHRHQTVTCVSDSHMCVRQSHVCNMNGTYHIAYLRHPVYFLGCVMSNIIESCYTRRKTVQFVKRTSRSMWLSDTHVTTVQFLKRTSRSNLNEQWSKLLGHGIYEESCHTWIGHGTCA